MDLTVANQRGAEINKVFTRSDEEPEWIEGGNRVARICRAIEIIIMAKGE